MMNVLEGLINDINKSSKIRISDISENLKEDTAVIVVDMVNGFCNEGVLSSERTYSIINPIVNLLNLTRECKKVFFVDSHTKESVEFRTYPGHCISGTTEEEIIEELKFFAYDDLNSIVIKKNSTNGFHVEQFKEWLSKNNTINNFIVVGVCTDICVETFSISLKTYFNQYNINKNIYIPVRCVETYESMDHNAKLMNSVSLFKMKSNGIKIVKEIEE